jgi:hypothetical protein
VEEGECGRFVVIVKVVLGRARMKVRVLVRACGWIDVSWWGELVIVPWRLKVATSISRTGDSRMQLN